MPSWRWPEAGASVRTDQTRSTLRSAGWLVRSPARAADSDRKTAFSTLPSRWRCYTGARPATGSRSAPQPYWEKPLRSRSTGTTKRRASLTYDRASSTGRTLRIRQRFSTRSLGRARLGMPHSGEPARLRRATEVGRCDERLATRDARAHQGEEGPAGSVTFGVRRFHSLAGIASLFVQLAA